MSKKLSPETLNELLRYEPETGRLFWRQRGRKFFGGDHSVAPWNARHAGEEAFTADDGGGYRHGKIFGKLYRAHRVIWAMESGEWPKDQIDHINGERSDNRIANLRSVSNFENSRNQKRHSNNTSGVTGVSWHKRDKRWLAKIKCGGKVHRLGCFDNIEDAIRKRKEAEKLFGFHENHGRPSQPNEDTP